MTSKRLAIAKSLSSAKHVVITTSRGVSRKSQLKAVKDAVDERLSKIPHSQTATLAVMLGMSCKATFKATAGDGRIEMRGLVRGEIGTL